VLQVLKLIEKIWVPEFAGTNRGNSVDSKILTPASVGALIFAAAVLDRGRHLWGTTGDGARRGARQRHRGGAPGGAAAYVTGRAHPASSEPRWRGPRRGCAGGSRGPPGRPVSLSYKGRRSAPPWRLPALHPLVL